MKVEIRSINEEGGYDIFERTEVWVDGVLLGDGSYGGEPEDNRRYRDYRWVEGLLAKLAKACGAEVECTNVTVVEEED